MVARSTCHWPCPCQTLLQYKTKHEGALMWHVFILPLRRVHSIFRNTRKVPRAQWSCHSVPARERPRRLVSFFHLRCLIHICSVYISSHFCTTPLVPHVRNDVEQIKWLLPLCLQIFWCIDSTNLRRWSFEALRCRGDVLQLSTHVFLHFSVKTTQVKTSCPKYWSGMAC